MMWVDESLEEGVFFLLMRSGKINKNAVLVGDYLLSKGLLVICSSLVA